MNTVKRSKACELARGATALRARGRSQAGDLAGTLGLARLAARVLQTLEVSGTQGLLALLERVPGRGAVQLLDHRAAAAVGAGDELEGGGFQG